MTLFIGWILGGILIGFFWIRSVINKEIFKQQRQDVWTKWARVMSCVQFADYSQP